MQKHRIEPSGHGDSCLICGHELDVVGNRFRHLPSTPPCSFEGCPNRSRAWFGNVGRNEAERCDSHTPEEWFQVTLIQAAAKLATSPDVLRQAIARGSLKAVKHGRDWWVEPAEVERYGRENRRPRGVGVLDEAVK